MDRADAIAAALREVQARHGPHALARGWSDPSRLLASARPDLPPWWPGQLPSLPRVVELAGPPSCGKLSLALSWLADLPTAGTIAVIDADRRFYPPAALRCGIALDRLVVVRPPDQRAAVEAALLLLGSAGFDAVLWPMAARTRFSGMTSARLAQRAARHQTTLFALVEHDGYRSRATASPLVSADARLAVAHHEWAWADGELAGVRLAVRGQVRGGVTSEWSFVVDARGERVAIGTDGLVARIEREKHSVAG